MAVAEEVVIDIIAKDNATSLLNNIKSVLESISSLSTKVAQNISNINPKINLDTSKINPNIEVNPNVTVPNDFGRYNIPQLPQYTSTQFGDYNRWNLPQGAYPGIPIDKPSSLNEVNNQLEKLRNNSKNTIKIKIDSGEVNNTNLRMIKTQQIINNVKENMGNIMKNASQSFAGSGGGFQLIGNSYYPPNFTMVGAPYDPTKLLGSGEGKYGANEIVKVNGSLKDASKSANNFASASAKAGKQSYSSFHQLNNMMVVVGGTFNNLSAQIAGIFGAAGLSGMIQKMWQGAAQRQQNMMYLMHQKGKAQATKYYNEIMDVVTQLPGDDTFLTNILNMATAMDKSIKLDNIKEVGSAITDYYMSATMKGENSYETQRDLRKYITTGNTRGLQNSIIASEIDLLKDKNSVLERTQALQKALEKTGFSGMSGYDSAINEFEELKGHFQKAFADLGEAVIAVTQPLMKFYNTLDTMFGGKISQGIIVVATILVGLFGIIGGGLVILSSSFRMIEVVTLAVEGLSYALTLEGEARSVLNTLLVMSVGAEKADAIASDGNVAAKMRETLALAKETIARKIGIDTKYIEIGTNKALLIGLLDNIKIRAIHFFTIVRETLMIIPNVFWKVKSGDANLREAFTEEIDTLAKNSNTIAVIRNTVSKLRRFANTLILVGAIVLATIMEWTNTKSVFGNTYAHLDNTAMKIVETEATLGLATATAILDALLAPELFLILAIIGAVIGLIVVIEKLGEALGWWEDLGSMFQSISDGINRLWNAFANSEIIRGISQYFGDFIATIQEMFQSIYDMLSMLFGWEDDNGTFDIVQSIIDAFGKLGEMLKWVWNLLDDWSNSPLGFVTTWLTPLGILIFHLDELGSFFEDIRDAVDRFTSSDEFQSLISAWNDAISALQEPFQEIWSLINEIIGLFGEIFGGEDPEGQGTEDRINFLVEIFKGLAFILQHTVIPTIRGVGRFLYIVLTPLRLILTVVRSVLEFFTGANKSAGDFGNALSVLSTPLLILQKLLEAIQKIKDVLGNAYRLVTLFGQAWLFMISPLGFVFAHIKQITEWILKVSDAIKNSFIGKLLGWDKEDKNKDDDDKQKVLNNLRKDVNKSDLKDDDKRSILSKLILGQNLTKENANDVRNLGSTYNHNNNQRQVVVNQNFSEGSMPIDARNMTKKEAKQMFIGAFGYRRAVGHNGILK